MGKHNLTRKVSISPRAVTAAVVVLTVGVIGVILLVSSHAATPYASVNADNGQVVSPGVTQGCSGTSDGNCVVFGSSSTGGTVPVDSVGPYFTASTGGTTACTAGCAVVGQALSVNTGTWTQSPTSYTYQWDRCTTTSAQPPTTASCTSISSATSSSYTVVSADSGHSLVPIVTAHNSSGASTPTSVTGSCDTGEIVVDGPISTYTPTIPSPTTPVAGCSPISAVVATTQTSERFCTNSVTTCGYADPMNGTAGVPAGTTLSSTGSCSQASINTASSTNGSTINGCLITNGLDINANNVTVENSDITGVNVEASIVYAEGQTGTQFLHDSIHGATPSDPNTAAWAIEGDNVTISNVYVYNIDRILMMYPNDGSSTVTNSFCWMNGEAGDEHHECIYSDGTTDLVATNDVLLNLQYETAAIFIDNPGTGGGGTNGTLTATNDIFSGGTYPIYGGGSSSNPHTGAENISNNRWSRIVFTTGGQFGTDAYVPAAATWSGNQWDDTNAVVN